METLEMLIWLSAATITFGREECPMFWMQVDSQCFRVVSSLAYDTVGFPTALHARRTCQQYGGDLAYIPNVHYESRAFGVLRSMSLDSIPRKVYIGLNDIKTDGRFEWMNGKAATFTDWAPAEPNNGYYTGDEDCVVAKSPDKTWRVSDTTEWHDYPCCVQAYITHALCSRGVNDTGDQARGLVSKENDALYNKCNKVDECLSNPCQNGGTCVDDFLGYTCDCLDEFHGTHCELNVTCALPNMRNATIGTLVRGEELADDPVIHSVLEVRCQPGFSFRETNNPVGKLFNCTVDGWKLLEAIVIKCKPLPTWTGLRSNETVSRYPGSPLNYSCAEGMKFTDESDDDFKLSVCNDTGHWDPALANCTEIVSKKAQFAQVKKPVEASGATVLGTFGLVFLISEIVMFVFMDLNVYRTQLCFAYANIKSWLGNQRRGSEFEAVPTQI